MLKPVNRPGHYQSLEDMTPSRPLFLVSCVSKKRSRPSEARDLHCSDWFLKARAYVEAQGAEWFILSAKYGLVPPRQVISPYNATLNDMSVSERSAWANGVASQLRARLHRGDKVVILAGQSYRHHLVPMLRQLGCEVEAPMRGLGIGQQLRWLKGRLPRTSGG